MVEPRRGRGTIRIQGAIRWVGVSVVRGGTDPSEMIRGAVRGGRVGWEAVQKRPVLFRGGAVECKGTRVGEGRGEPLRVREGRSRSDEFTQGVVSISMKNKGNGGRKGARIKEQEDKTGGKGSAIFL